MKNKYIINLLFIIICIKLSICVPIRDYNGDPLMTETPYYIRVWDQDIQGVRNGVTYEVYVSWDYLLLTNNDKNPGTTVTFKTTDSVEKQIPQQINVGDDVYIWMNHCDYEGYQWFSGDLDNGLYLSQSSANIYQIDNTLDINIRNKTTPSNVWFAYFIMIDISVPLYGYICTLGYPYSGDWLYNGDYLSCGGKDINPFVLIPK